MFLEAFDVTSDGVFDIGDGFGARSALGDTAGEGRAFRDERSVFILFNYDAVSHRLSIQVLPSSSNDRRVKSSIIGRLGDADCGPDERGTIKTNV